jgi:hypothetical protein
LIAWEFATKKTGDPMWSRPLEVELDRSRGWMKLVFGDLIRNRGFPLGRGFSTALRGRGGGFFGEHGVDILDLHRHRRRFGVCHLFGVISANPRAETFGETQRGALLFGTGFSVGSERDQNGNRRVRVGSPELEKSAVSARIFNVGEEGGDQIGFSRGHNECNSHDILLGMYYPTTISKKKPPRCENVGAQGVCSKQKALL